MQKFTKDTRHTFPSRAVITAGMPYGNKDLHFGHIGGMFVHADVFARFLRDRIGGENVLFVSGTDCYGSPIIESYRLAVAAGFSHSIEEYVLEKHNNQKRTLEDYQISLDLYGTSAFGRTGQVHKEVSEQVFLGLYEKGMLERLSTPQFYDDQAGVFLNGRQVQGKCPIEGCQSEKAYADECALGHQYMPSELLDPVSTLSGKTPTLKNVTNWYFKLEECYEFLGEYALCLEKETTARRYMVNTIREFLKPPVIYVPRQHIDECVGFGRVEDDGKKPSVTWVLENLKQRDTARGVLDAKGIRYRTGKTLVPFRLTGNAEWGVAVPEIDGEKGLTFWVWPESLWAPISFVKTALGERSNEWEKWWTGQGAKVYQFMGEDNIYFYTVAQTPMFAALFGGGKGAAQQNLPLPVPNRHILFMDKKAGSSSQIKPPMAAELLEHYTAEQLRIHFLSLGLSDKSTGFNPQAYKEEKEGADTVLKEGNLLTNVYNRLVRSCFYSVQSDFSGEIPLNNVRADIVDMVEQSVLEYEHHMYKQDFHRVTYVLDSLIRGLNKHWVNNIKLAENTGDLELKRQILADCFYGLRVAAVLIHPIAPAGCEMVAEYLGIGESMWSWDNIFKDLHYFIKGQDWGGLKKLEPRVDFFKKHNCQIEQGQ